ncbi:hypothetical protein PCASD_20048 [Puccinia coronata f. sp. avenae]|uniref:Uncharacterized protein n=1 Tax=Puccinia coronata f. sp. avenae TaxID=200324 RepID=A0A2N5TPC6_9BASI|nr:hypothetical protein PCASD_20048 [Puccinia coronata f. sp. avenae]
MPAKFPLVRLLGRLTIPVAKPLLLGPILSLGVDSLPLTGIGVASVGTRPSLTQHALASFFLSFHPGISTGRIVGFPFALPQQSTAYCMTVICTAKATRRSTPYPDQSSISQLYCRQSRASLTMNSSSAKIRATPAAVIPPLEDIYFNSNGVLFRNGIAIVNQRGSIIQRPIVERPLPVFRPTLVDSETEGSAIQFPKV